MVFLARAALAHGGDITKIHACVRPTLLGGAPNIRIVGENDTCKNNETALDWDREASAGGTGPLVCPACGKKDILLRIGGTSLSGRNFDKAILSQAQFDNEDLSNSSFVGAMLLAVNTAAGSSDLPGIPSNLSGVDFTDANANGFQGSSANFTAANFTRADLTTAVFSDREGYPNGADLTNANFTGANLTRAHMRNAITTGADFTDVIWNHTVCPDNTNSDDNGGTCIGHLTP